MVIVSCAKTEPTATAPSAKIMAATATSLLLNLNCNTTSLLRSIRQWQVAATI